MMHGTHLGSEHEAEDLCFPHYELVILAKHCVSMPSMHLD